MTLPLDPPVDLSAGPEGGEGRATGSVWRLIFDVFIKNRLAVVGLLIIIFMVLFSFVGPLFYHTDQVHTNLHEITLPPSSAHPLGTDNLGYDVLGRLMLGGQSSLEVGLAAALLASIVGTAWGAVSGFAGGWNDAIMMRVVDFLLAIPYLLFVLLLASIFTPTVPVLIIVIAMVLVAVHRQARPRRHAVASGQGLRRRGQGGRNPQRADRHTPHHPERHGYRRGRYDILSRRCHPASRRAQLPRAWPPAARCELGRHADKRPQLRLRGILVADLPSRHSHRADSCSIQLHRRCPEKTLLRCGSRGADTARCSRSTAPPGPR